MKILYIDDDPDDLEIFKDVLGQIDDSIELIAVSDCEDAFRLLTTMGRLPNFIFLDLNMPRMSGFECVKLLKSYKDVKRIPIIICTTSATKQQRKNVIESGAQDLIIKQGTFQKMKETVQLVLQKDYQLIYEK